MSYEDVSKTLNAAVLQLTPAELPQFLADHDTDFTSRPFTDYMRMEFREKALHRRMSLSPPIWTTKPVTS